MSAQHALTACALITAFFVSACGDARAGHEQTDTPVPVPNPIGTGFGVQVQPWYLQPNDLARIEAMGFRVVRWGISWDRVERERGVYDWREVDGFVERLRATRLRSIVILGFGNALYGASERSGGSQLFDPRPPTSPEARAAFARFAAAAAARYRDRQIAWEIWNEPDNAGFWAPHPDPSTYATIAGNACRAIKVASPEAQVIAGAGAAMPDALAGRSNDIYAALAQSSAAGCIDAVSSHAYRIRFGYEEPDPESIEDDIRESRRRLYGELQLPARVRFVVSEWGFPTSSLSPNLQAAYAIRASLVTAAAGIPLTIWYEWRDSRAETADPEAHFGLLSLAGGAKGGERLRCLARIAGATLIRRVAVPARPDVRAYLLQRDGSRFVVTWLSTANEVVRSRLSIDGHYRVDISYMPVLVAVGTKENLVLTVN